MVYIYQIMENEVIHYTDVPSSILKPKQGSTIAFFQPVAILKHYQQYQWHIRTYPYETLKIILHASNTTTKENLSVTVHDGPPFAGDDLCILKASFKLLPQNLSTTTKAFQALVTMTLERDSHFTHTIAYTRMQNDIAVIDYNWSLPDKSIQFPGTECKLTSPITLCHFYIKALGVNDTNFISASIDEIDHTAPNDPTCHYIGLSWINLPQHVIAEWLGQSFKMYRPSLKKNGTNNILADVGSMDIYEQVYKQYTICNLDWLEERSSELQSLHSTTSQVLLTIYAYTSFLSSKPSIYVTLKASRIQTVPFPLDVRMNLFLVKTEEESNDLNKHAIHECFKQIISCSWDSNEFHERNGDVIEDLNLLGWVFFAYQKKTYRMSKHMHNMALNALRYETFLQCIAVGVNFFGYAPTLMYIDTQSEVLVCYPPFDTTAYHTKTILVIGNGKTTAEDGFALLEYSLQPFTHAYSRDAVKTLLYRFTGDWYLFVRFYSACNVLKSKKNVTNEKRVAKFEGYCSVFSIKLNMALSYTMLWVVVRFSSVINVQYSVTNCSKDISVCLDVRSRSTAISVPYLTRSLTIWPDKLAILPPYQIQANVKVNLNNTSTTATFDPTCLLKLELINRQVFEVFEERPAKMRLIGLGRFPKPQYKIEHENHVHYTISPGSKKRTWEQVNAFCKEYYRGQPLLYLSQEELYEVTNHASNMHGMVFTAFYTNKTVSPSRADPENLIWRGHEYSNPRVAPIDHV